MLAEVVAGSLEPGRVRLAGPEAAEVVLFTAGHDLRCDVFCAEGAVLGATDDERLSGTTTAYARVHAHLMSPVMVMTVESPMATRTFTIRGQSKMSRSRM